MNDADAQISDYRKCRTCDKLKAINAFYHAARQDKLLKTCHDCRIIGQEAQKKCREKENFLPAVCEDAFWISLNRLWRPTDHVNA